jgi:hypothetical protein
MLARMTQSGRAASTTVARGAALALALAVSSLAFAGATPRPRSHN